MFSSQILFYQNTKTEGIPALVLSLWILHVWYLRLIPVTDGDEKVFGGGGEELKVSDVQLLHLDGLTELDDEPG